ncbi:acyl-homoserine-lactone synthase [Limnohabitans sp.]|uniref:acyl-homoserine-lactone synthase n=1 Tax=Limnohabitans sp. TaxID=1907725 RepID=UPI0031200805
MLNYTTGTRPQLAPHVFERMGVYRREVFIDRLGWDLPIIDGMELDEFDDLNALYVCSHDNNGQVNGVARLLPTTGPYLMGKVFPHLWAGATLPQDPQVWELSRFATSDLDNIPGLAATSTPTTSASQLLHRVIGLAASKGAHSLITVTTVVLERLLRQKGFQAKRTGLPVMHLGTPIVGLNISIDNHHI